MDRTPFAFISYSRNDVKVAQYLQQRIEKYVYPKDIVTMENRPEDKYNVRPIFLDLTDLSIRNNNFSDEIRENLRTARYLIVICSRYSANSPFVKSEIDFFLSTHNNDLERVIPVYVDQILEGIHPSVDQILVTRNCPIFIVGKGDAGHVGRTYCFYHIMEFLLKVDFYKLYNRYEEYKRQKNRIRSTIVAVVLTVIISSLSFGWYKQYQATIVEHNLAVTEHDFAQFEKETFPFSLVVGYVDNFLAPTLEAIKDSLKSQTSKTPHIIVIMPNTYNQIDEQERKSHLLQRKDSFEKFGHGYYLGSETEMIRIKSRKRASSIVRLYFANISTPIYQDYASTVKAIRSVVDYKFDVDRHLVRIDTTLMSRDELVRGYSLQFVRLAKDRLGKDSVNVHFVFSYDDFANTMEKIKSNEIL